MKNRGTDTKFFNLQVLWWFTSILMFGLAAYLFVAYKPVFELSLSDFIFGVLVGSLSYFFGKLMQFLSHKQLMNIPMVFVNSVLLAPIAEEILFRFGVITLLFGNSLAGVLVSIVAWAILHLIYESISSPIKYYRTYRGLVHILFSGTILAVVYIFSGFNLFAVWVAHALHNLLIWLSLVSPTPNALSTLSMGKAASSRSSSTSLSRHSPNTNLNSVLFKTEPIIFSIKKPIYNSMRKVKLLLSFKCLLPALLALALLIPLAAADVPKLINLQGKLTDASKNPLIDSVNLITLLGLITISSTFNPMQKLNNSEKRIYYSGELN